MKRFLTLQNIGFFIILIGFGATIYCDIYKTGFCEEWQEAFDIMWPLGLLIWALGEMQKGKKEKTDETP